MRSRIAVAATAVALSIGTSGAALGGVFVGATRATTAGPGVAGPVTIGPGASPIVAAHDATMARVVHAWRAVHPAPPVPPPPPPPPPPAPAPAVLTDATTTTTPDWACIRTHESGNRFNTPSAPGGAYGFLESTWLSLGYSGWPYQAAPAVQDKAVLFLFNELGWQPWSTRFVCGL